MPTKIVAADGSGDFLNMEALRLHMASISVAITEPFIVQIKGAVDCASESLGYPPGTSAANYLMFEGVVGTNPKITNENTPTKEAFKLGVQHLRLLNLTLESNSSALALAGTGSASGYTLYIENTKILQPNTTANPNYTIQVNPAVVLFRNVLFVGKNRGIDFRPATTGDVKVLNSTIWLTSGDYPALLHANTKVYNSYAGNAGTSTKDWLLTGTVTNGSNNASKDTSATTITTVAGVGGVGASAFTNTIAYDFSLASGSPLLDVGATLAENTTDINGIVRPQGAAYDIGAYERLSGGTAPISFSGTIPNQTFTAGQAVSVNLATYFTGTLTPFTFANTGTSLTGTGLSITSAGLLSGTATTGSVSGVVVTGTDASSNTAASNAFNVTVNAAATPVAFSGTIPAISGTQNSVITPVNTSTYFTGSLTPFTYSLFSGTLPSGVTLNSSTGVISGTPTVSFSGNIVVRATDTGSNVANSNSIAVNIAAAIVDGTITLADLKNNTATPLASTSGFYVTILSATNPKSVVYNTASVSSNASAAITFTNPAIIQGTEYRYFIEKDGVAFAAGKVTAT